MTIKKAIIPAAGLGTRFLPATKAQPKEMLPIVDTPTIQFVVEEAVKSGIEDILIITGSGKRAIEDHFDRNFELEHNLQQNEKKELLEQVQKISNLVNICFIRQKNLKGLGGAIYHAKLYVDDEPFAVLLGDTIITAKTPATLQLIHQYEKFKAPIIGAEEVEKEKVDRYGIINGEKISEQIFKIKSLIEKPKINNAPSNLAVSGRYILTPEIFSYIEKVPPKKGEVGITEALSAYAKDKNIYAYKLKGKRHDIGNKLDYLKTTVEFALKRSDIKDEFKQFLIEILKNETTRRTTQNSLRETCCSKKSGD